jgi:hypothetical protein
VSTLIQDETTQPETKQRNLKKPVAAVFQARFPGKSVWRNHSLKANSLKLFNSLIQLARQPFIVARRCPVLTFPPVFRAGF